MKRVVVARPMDGRGMKFLRDGLAGVASVEHAPRREDFFRIDDRSGVQAVAGNQLPEAVFDAFPGLQFVQVLGAGTDGVDLEAAKRRGIDVGNSHSNAEPVAEHAVALLLDCTRRVSAAGSYLRSGLSRTETLRRLPRPVTLAGKTIGLLGFGAVGQAVAKRLSPFEANVLAATRSGHVPHRWKGEVKVVAVNRLFQSSDAVVLCVPSTPDTVNIVSRSLLDSMTEDAIIVNVSRSNVVDEVAVADSVANGSLWYATDVWGAQDTPASIRFVQSPYWAGLDGDQPTHLYGAVENLRAWAEGREAPYKVDLLKGY